MYGLRAQRTDDALQRGLARAYTSLASVLLALRSSSHLRAALRGAAADAAGAHVPWRDSPLTKWLRPRLATSASVVVLATVAPGVDCAAETLATLNYVSRFRSPAAGGGVLVKPSWDAPDAAVGTVDRSQDRDDRPRRSLDMQSPGWDGDDDGGQWHERAQGHSHARDTADCPQHGRARMYDPLSSPKSLDSCDGAGARRPQRGSPRKQETRSPLKVQTGRGQAQHEYADGLTFQRNRSGSPHRRAPSQGEAAAHAQVLQALRRAGGCLREEALLEQLVHSLASARCRVRLFARVRLCSAPYLPATVFIIASQRIGTSC